MAERTPTKANGFHEPESVSAEHYRSLRHRTIIRLSLTYLSPVIILATYFLLQYSAVVSESERLHLKAMAESQANTLDLFLSERQVNLSNLIDDRGFPLKPTSADLDHDLRGLRRISDVFVDIGFFDSSGVQVAYAGPYPSLEKTGLPRGGMVRYPEGATSQLHHH